MEPEDGRAPRRSEPEFGEIAELDERAGSRHGLQNLRSHSCGRLVHDDYVTLSVRSCWSEVASGKCRMRSMRRKYEGGYTAL